MPKQLFANNATSSLSGILTQGGTTLVCAGGEGSRFPTPDNGNYFLLTIFTKDAYANEQQVEVVKVTARSGDVMTIERDAEGLTGNVGGNAYNGSTTPVFLELRWTALGASNTLQASDNLAALQSAAAARTNLGLGSVDNTADLDKPISTATQTALNGKAPTGHTHAVGDISGLATVASSGSYMDLANKPSIPTVPAQVSAFTNDSGYQTAANVATALAGSGFTKPNVATSWTAEQTFKEVKDTVFTITDAAGFSIDPANGSVQIVTITVGRTPVATNFEAGQTVLLGISGNFAITWTSVNPTWVKAGGTASAPSAAASGYLWVLLWKVGSTMYAAEVGKV